VTKAKTEARMTPAEVAEAREALGLTPEGLAAALGVSVREASAWKAGTHPIDRHSAGALAFLAAAARRERALEAAGLAQCAWMAAWEAKPFPETSRAARRHAQEVDEHLERCERCQARVAYAAQHLPEIEFPPRPNDWFARLDAFAAAVDRLPVWLRPAAWGAAFFGVATLVRAVGTLLMRGSFALCMIPVMVAFGAVLGAIGGVAYALVRGPARRLGRAGPAVTGVACVWAYFIPTCAIVSWNQGFDPALWIGVLAIGAGMGALMGHLALRESPGSA
jgi:transcriptional regulator with XRE-family HTH domain